MTEKIEYFDTPENRRKVRSPCARYAVDPVAFANALICAPVLVAVCGFWALGIPVFALIIGGPIYLVVGTPVLLTYLHFCPGTPLGASGLALASVGILTVLALVLPLLIDSTQNIEGIAFIGGFGSFFGPIWGMAFGWLYNRWRSDISRQPLPPIA